MKDDNSLSLIILPFEDVKKLDLLKNTNWQYVADITAYTQDDDKEEEWKEQIKPFFGTKFEKKSK